MNKPLYPVIILAGGLATRLRPLSETIPKSMVDINGKPFIDHQLAWLKREGIQDVIIAAGYLGEMLATHVGDGHRYGLKVQFAFDGKELVGTAGAIRNIKDQLPEKFFVLYGDSYLQCDFTSIQHSFDLSHKLALMTVYENRNSGDKSNVEFSNEEIVCYDKAHPTDRMHHIDYGLGLFNKKVLDLIPMQGAYDLANLYKLLIDRKALAAYEVNARFYEIGSYQGISDTTDFLKK